MSGGFGEAASMPTQNSSFSNSNDSNNDDAGNFECGICFDSAQDPVVTLCGHLFCWPCLYKWLHIHSHSPECPICKALVQEEKLVPLYGRGKSSTDRSSKSVPGVNIPNRPAALSPDRNGFVERGLRGSGLMGGIGSSMTISFGNIAFSFGCSDPSIFNVQMHEYIGQPMSGNARASGHSHERHHVHEVCATLFIVGLFFLFVLFWE